MEFDTPYPRIFNAKHIGDRKIDELVGICRGVMADGKVDQSEAEFILKWIERNREFISGPAIILYERLMDMLKDNILDDDEKKDLFELLESFTGGEPILGDIESNTTTLPLDKPEPNIIHEGRSFVLTGIFTVGPRKKCEEIIMEKGGIVHKGIRKDTNYLIVGDLGNKDWIHSNYGRKIEKAIDYKSRGLEIFIVSEHHWIKYV